MCLVGQENMFFDPLAVYFLLFFLWNLNEYYNFLSKLILFYEAFKNDTQK